MKTTNPVWEGKLRNCPCCKAGPRVFVYDDKVEILCSQYGCRHVSGKTLAEASTVWNQKSFRDP